MNWEDVVELTKKYFLTKNIDNTDVAVDKETKKLCYDEEVILPLRFFENLSISLSNVNKELSSEEICEEMCSEQTGYIFNLLKTLAHFCIKTDCSKLDEGIILEFKDALRTHPNSNEVLEDFVTNKQKNKNINLINELFVSKEIVAQNECVKRRIKAAE